MKVSSAFNTLLHIIWTGLIGLILSGAQAVFQYNTVHGINFGQDAITFALVVVTGAGSTAIAIWNNIQRSPALPVAEQEVESAIAMEAHKLAMDAQGKVDQLTQWLTAHLQYHDVATKAVQSVGVPSSLRPTTLQPIPDANTPVAPVSVPNVAPANAVPLSTIPAMPVVTPQ